MDVRKIAKLAHLEITDEEVALYTPQMNDIVAYVEQLNELDTETVEPAIGGLTPEGEATGNQPRRYSARIARSKSCARQAPSASEVIFKFRKCYEFRISISEFRLICVQIYF